METDNNEGAESSPSPPEQETWKILPLVESSGNMEVLQNWIDGRESFALVRETHDIATADFDCLICDRQTLWEHRESLISRKQTEAAVVPYVLLAEESEEKRIREQLRTEHPELWRTVNAVIELPIPEYRLTDRIQTLMEMRAQALDLHEKQEQLRAIRDEHAGHGVLITDRNGTIEFVNTAFENQSGYDRNEVIGKTPRILQSGEHGEEFYEDLWDTILSGEVWQGEIINERKDGQQYILNQTIAPVTDSAGEIERFIAVNHEITQLKQLETSLRSQREQLAILNRVLRHDIRNDLHVMLGWTDALEALTDEQGEEYLDRIQRSGEHIVELTEVAKDIAEEVFADGDPDLEPIDLSQVLEEEVQKRREAFEAAAIEIVEIPDSSTVVWANQMLSSVFRNLINNAVQHNDTDTPEVEISVEAENGTVTVRIADNGPGIPEERKGQIFEEGKQGLDSEGTGMGLFLVQSLVEGYGGTVTVEDNKPRGAVFAFELQTVESPDHPGSEP